MRKHIFIYGFSIFSMFFGSGNLVFPLKIGAVTGSNWLYGFLGLFITGIILPFLGLFVIKLHKGSYDNFFGEAGHISRILLPLFTLSLLGAFGVVPRCITVAHGGIEYLFPEVPLIGFSITFCIICFFLCLNDKFMITILGKWFTPIKLILLTILITIGVVSAKTLSPSILTPNYSFTFGFAKGYQLMDLFAAFFFSSLIFKQIQELVGKDGDPKKTILLALKPSFIGAFLLALAYLGFTFLGAHYQDIAADLSPELILPAIAQHLLGRYAAFIISITITLSCISTAVALNNIYARYLCQLCKLPSNYFPLFLIGTTATSFLVSLLDFKGIASFLSPALEISYPALIALTLLSIFVKKHQIVKMVIFYSMILIAIIYKYLL